MRRTCSEHSHPSLRRPVPRSRVESELWSLYEKAGLSGRPSVVWTEELRRTHDKNTRRYAQVLPGRDPRFELAPQVARLPWRNREALLAHEIGHVLDPEGGEDDADEAAFQALGVKIGYDRRWPGKGLQVRVNPDDRLRSLEREAALGDAEAFARLRAEQARRGQLFTMSGVPLGVWEEIDEDHFGYALNAVPPRKWWGPGFVSGEPYSSTLAGDTVYSMFEKAIDPATGRDRYFKTLTTLKTVDSHLNELKRAGASRNPPDFDCEIRKIDPEEDWELADEAYRLFRDLGVRPENHEEIEYVCVSRSGLVKGALAIGLYSALPDESDPLGRPRFSMSIVVDPEAQGLGVGKALVREVEVDYPRDEVLVEAKVVNPIAGRLLKGFGYQYELEEPEEWSNFDRSWGRRIYRPNPHARWS